MNSQSMLRSGLYRICGALPASVRPRAATDISKRHTTLPRRVVFGFVVLAGLAWAGSMTAQADVADTLLIVKPAVVGVGTYSPTGRPRAKLMGTGFAVLDGTYVVTCAHIFAKPIDTEKNETVAVFLGRDREMSARVSQLVAVDKAHDLALLKVSGAPLATLKLGDSTRAREGWQLYFTGYPLGSVLGLNPSTHRAGLAAIIPIFTPVASAAQLNMRALKQAGDAYEVFELDAIAYPGNSGSPVWHPDTGEVLGVLNSVYVKGAKETALSAPSGISYAIPAKYVRALLEQAQAKKP